MEVTVAKLVSLGPALAIVAGSLLLTRELSAAAGIGFLLLFPLALIWFPEFWGERIAGRFTAESPAVLVAIGGWLLLFGIPLALYLLARQR